MLFRKLWRTMGKYKAQFISMIIMIFLGVGIFIGFNMEWFSIKGNTDYFRDATNFADFSIVQETGFSTEDMLNVKNIQGVTDAGRYISVVSEVEGFSGDTVALTVTENKNISYFMNTSGAAYDPLSTDGIWLGDRYAKNNNIKLGDDLTLSYKGMNFSGKVVGLVKSSEYTVNIKDKTELIPNFDSHGFAYISPVFYKNVLGMDFFPQINVISDLSKQEFISKVNDVFNKTMMVLSKNEKISYAGPQGEVEEGQTMGAIIPVIFLLIGVLSMVTTMHRLTANEKLQIGTLKALGFKDRKILTHYMTYALVVGIIGCVLGYGLGFFIAWFIMNEGGSMGIYLDMPQWKLYVPWFCYLVMALVIAILVLICFLSTRQMLKGNAAQSLQPYTPKKVKPMLIEKSKSFHKLSFGVRWNLRDLARHKARMFMSVFGVLSCVLIILCVFGLNDSCQAFMNEYYGDANNYNSVININTDATIEQRENLLELYNGETSGTISVEFKDKAISLIVYDGKSKNASDNKLRFLDKKSRFVNLADDGAYVCMRIADDYKLKPGDYIEVSPYGTDILYNIKVAGVVRNMVESVVMSKTYASTLNIQYVMDTIYTDVEKKDVAKSAAIYSIQSKQMLIDSFKTVLDVMVLMITIFIIAAIVLGIVVLYNLGIMNYTERYRELATLKVLGFKDKKISKILIVQNLWTTITGIILGLPLSVVFLNLINKALLKEYEMPTKISPISFIITIAIILVMTLLVSLMLSRKNKKIDMVESLKGRE